MTGMIGDTGAQGRASLGKPDRRYLMHEESDGTLVLEPAVVMTELERSFLANTGLQNRIEEARRHPERQVTRQRQRLSA